MENLNSGGSDRRSIEPLIFFKNYSIHQSESEMMYNFDVLQFLGFQIDRSYRDDLGSVIAGVSRKRGMGFQSVTRVDFGVARRHRGVETGT